MTARTSYSLLLGLLTGVCTLQANPPAASLPPLPWTNAPQLPPGLPTPMMHPLHAIPQATLLTPPPLLYLRFEGPEGSTVTFFRDNETGQKLGLPCVVGFRPGYVYRCALANLPGKPGVTYFPTFEIRGTMLLGHKLRNADFPATVVFREEDLDRVSQGTLLHKVIILERPNRAMPLSSTPSSPVEVVVPPGQDPLAEARQIGLPLALFYLGQRKFAPDEMRPVPGTVYLPGDKTLPAPAAAPDIHFQCYPLVDPSLKSVPASEYITVYDGGDIDAPAGFDRSGTLRGVDPSDTVAEYRDSKARKKVAVSNRVGLCIPRFVLLRSEIGPDLRATVHMPTAAVALTQRGLHESVYHVSANIHKTQLELTRNQTKASGTSALYGTTALGSVRGTQVKAIVAAPSTLDGLKPLLKSEEEDLPLCIIKWPDRTGVLVGEVLTFYVKYTNHGKQPIQDVVVLDNLTPRFEYVPGTAKTDRDGGFTFQPNNVGSHLLRWEFNGPLLPGESGLISFMVKVR